MSDWHYTELGRVDLKELFAEWEEEELPSDYVEPRTGWHVLLGKVFENDTALILFDNPLRKGAPYYRWLRYDLRGEEPKLIGKYRSRLDGCTAIGFGSGEEYLLMAMVDPKIDKRYISLHSFDPKEQEEDLPDEPAFLEQSRRVFLMLSDEGEILFYRTPDGVELHTENEKENLLRLLKTYDSGKRKTVGPSGEEKLNALIGLGNVKRQMHRMIAFAKMQAAMKSAGKPTENLCFNMAFLGNPGTAKTTVARLTAQILKENGLLSKGELVEVGRADLIAEYLGQTAPKVREVFEEAKGSLLFIDEAYSLTADSSDDYAIEAINTIVQEMENCRGDLIVVFAGYPDEMRDFLSRNPGLRSRVPFVIEFDDYSEDELLEIARMIASERGFSVSGDAENVFRENCRVAMEEADFGNGRFSRNQIEAAILNYAERVFGSDPDAENDWILREEDLESIEPPAPSEPERCIGFVA